MSTYNDASLIYYPSGYKAGTAYSLKPTDGSGDLTFTRASTATRVNADGLIEEVATGVPRIDFTGGGCAKLILEPQRTNLVKNSANVGAGFVVGNITLVLNNAAAPNGLVEADKFYPTTSGGNRWFYQAVTTSASSTISVFAKAAGKDILYISQGGGTDVSFNLSSGLVTYESSGWVGSIEDFGDGWYRCIAVRSSSVSFAAYGVADSSGGSFVTASGTDGILVWGMQCEQGSYSTSLINTSGVAVTRVADKATKSAISSLIGQTEGTIFLDFIFKTPKNPTDGQIAITAIGGVNNRVVIWNNSTLNTIAVTIQANGATIFNTSLGSFIDGQQYKIAIGYKSGDNIAYVNGTQVFSNSISFAFGLTLTDFILGGYEAAQEPHQRTQSVIIFPTRLSNAELATLTTI